MLIPPGRYRAQSRKAELGETSTNKEQVGVEFEITDGDLKGTRLVWYGYFTENTTVRTIESLRIAGWRGEDITELGDLARADAPTVELVVEHEVYEGKTTSKVRWVNRAGGLSMKTQLTPDKKAAFAARLRGSIAAVDQDLKQSGQLPPSGSGQPPAAKPAGDVPF